MWSFKFIIELKKKYSDLIFFVIRIKKIKGNTEGHSATTNTIYKLFQ